MVQHLQSVITAMTYYTQAKAQYVGQIGIEVVHTNSVARSSKVAKAWMIHPAVSKIFHYL